MRQVELACLRSKPKLIGKGVYRRVYRLGNFAIKVEKTSRDVKKMLVRAREVREHNLRINQDLDFIPRFYGIVMTGERKKRWAPVLVTFHEFVPRMSFSSLKNLQAMFRLIGKAADRGYVLDIKPSNFGKRRNRVYYLDERGVGKGPIPPDVFEDFSKLVSYFIRLSKKVARSRVRLSKK